MKIVYLINQYPKLSHSFIRREIRALEKKGVEVVRVSIRRPPDSPDPDDRSEAAKTQILLANPIGLLSRLALGFATRPLRMLRTLYSALKLSKDADRGVIAHVAYFVEANRLAQIVETEDASHIHAHFGTNPPLVALLTGALCGVSHSFTIHGPEEFDRPLSLKLTEKIQDASFVAAVSSFGRSQLMRWCPQQHWSKIKVVRCGLDDSYLSPESHNMSEFPNAPEPPRYEGDTLVCVGRLCEQKGQLLLVEAMSVLKQRGVRAKLILAGDGDMRGQIEDRIRVLGLSDQITITGWLSGEDVRRCLLRGKAMVLPSFAEGLPVVIMEAFALGRPVVTTYIAGIPELVKQQENGWLVPAGCVDALADAMIEVIQSSPETIQTMAHHARQSVSRHHNIDDIATQLRSHFAEREASPIQRANESASVRPGVVASQ